MCKSVAGYAKVQCRNGHFGHSNGFLTTQVEFRTKSVWISVTSNLPSFVKRTILQAGI